MNFSPSKQSVDGSNPSGGAYYSRAFQPSTTRHSSGCLVAGPLRDHFLREHVLSGPQEQQAMDGRHIRLDGTVTTIAGDWCRVLITLERRSRQFNMPPVHISMQTRLRDLDHSTTAHCWGRLTAMAIDRRRKTGSSDCKFCANF